MNDGRNINTSQTEEDSLPPDVSEVISVSVFEIAAVLSMDSCLCPVLLHPALPEV